MRGFAIIASLTLALSAAPLFAQQAAPAKPAPAPAAQQPPAQPAPAPQPPVPFPQGSKFAYVNIQRVVQESNDGKSSSTKVQALIQKKQNEGAEKQKQLAANQAKLQQSGGVLSDSARGLLEKEIERQNVEAQRFQQDAQAEINELQQELQNEFQRKLFPILQQVAQEKGLQILFNASEAGFLWADAALDLTADVVKKLDAAAPAPAAPKK